LISAGIEEAQALRNQWNEAYAWLSEREHEALSLLARSIMNHEGKTFQERLEQAVLRLITGPSCNATTNVFESKTKRFP